MTTLAVAMTLVSLVVVVRALRAPFNPGNFLAIVAASSNIVFLLVAQWRIFPSEMARYAFIQYTYDGTWMGTGATYIGVALLGLLGTALARRLSPPEGTTGGGERIRGADRVIRQLASAHRGSILIAGGLALGVCVWHLVFVGQVVLEGYAQYLSVRSPEHLGIRSATLASVHVNLPLVGLLCWPVGIVLLSVKERFTASMYLLAGSYSLLISLAFVSRFAALMLAVAAASRTVTIGRVDRTTIALGMVALLFLNGVLATRDVVEATRGLYGVDAVLANTTGGGSLGQRLMFIAFNALNGALIFGVSTQGVSVTPYPLGYKMLSFSPLPSAIDGFDSVRGYEQRVNAFVPFGNLAEAWWFGPVFFVAFLAVLSLVILCGEWAWRRSPRSLAFMASAPIYYALLRMHAYPIRNTFRWFLLGALLSVAVGWWGTPRVSSRIGRPRTP